jgi:hypothetical protein
MIAKVKIGKEVIEFEVEKGVLESIYEFAEEFASEIYEVVFNALNTKVDKIKVRFEGLDDEQKKVLNEFIKGNKVYVSDDYFAVEREFIGIALMMIAKVAIPDDDDFTTDNPIFNIVVGLTQRYFEGKIPSKKRLLGKIKECLRLAYPLKF